FFVNASSARHNVASIKRDKAAAISEEGIAYGLQILAPTWASTPGPLTGTFPPDCNAATGVYIPSADGGKFRLTCANAGPATWPPIQPYQVYIKATAYELDTQANLRPIRAIGAYVSQKTVTASLPSGLNAPVALRLATHYNAV